MIGIDISDRSVKVAHLSGGERRRLNAYASQEMPQGFMEGGIIQDVEQTKKLIVSVLEQAKLTPHARDAVVASIPETQSFVRVIQVPNMREDEVGEAMQWEVAQHIPFGLENVYIDWQPLVGGHRMAAGHREILVGAAQKQVVDPLHRLFSELEMDVAAFELESQALVRALMSDELKSRQGVLIVDLGGASTNVVVNDHGTVRFTASLQRGSDQMRKQLTAEEIEKVDYKPEEMTEADRKSVLEKLSQMYQDLVVEINGVVEFYNSIDAQHAVKEIIVTGGGSNLPGLDKAFLKVFDDVHIERGNPWVNIVGGEKEHLLPLALYESVRYSTALGLAMRSVLI